MQCFILIPYMLKASQHDQSTDQVIYRLLDLVTFVAPPGVPLLLLVLSAVAMIRLRKLGLVLLHGEVVKQGAAVDVVCFDKTGTLTHNTVGHTPHFALVLFIIYCWLMPALLLLARSLALTLMHSLALSLRHIHSLARSLTHSITHSLPCSLPHSLASSLARSLTSPFPLSVYPSIHQLTCLSIYPSIHPYYT